MDLVFIGYGTIAHIIGAELKTQHMAEIKIVGVLDPVITEDQTRELFAENISVYKDIDQVIERKPDLVIEAANAAVAKKYTPFLLSKGINVMSMSVGAYLDPEVMKKIRNEARGRLYLSSGALPCVDAVKAASVRGINLVQLTTRKRPLALSGAPGLSDLDVELDKIKEPCVVFEGNAIEAVKAFPANVNIAATLSLAGVGPLRTNVKIIADPSVTRNIHTILVEGDFGKLESTIECMPSENPKTSLIAALSAIALLKDLISPVKIGS